ncbi:MULTISPECIES: ANTAR domain-containing protein [unclassified Streptomyces]|uniref:ANTAR domain-containing protein n=1 Tax=unclassified Streptomyces TaxID=2593676 RepID=UPI0036F9E0C0
MQSALVAKATLEIAKGMLAAYADISIAEAGRRLSDHAAHHRVSLAETAHALVKRTMQPSDITRTPAGG